MYKKTLTIGKYEFHIKEREDIKTYPNHKYQVIHIQRTPKAKYSKHKVLSNYVYKTLEEATERAQEKFDNIKANIDARERKKLEKKNLNASIKASDFYKIGDIVYNSWGYEQTNVEFYQVVKITPKTITVKEIAQEIADESMEGHGMSCDVLGVKDIFLENGNEYRLNVKAWNKDSHYLTGVARYCSFSKWHGRPVYKSWYY
jgi:hypothetical protein